MLAKVGNQMRARWAFFLAPIIPAILPGYRWHVSHPQQLALSGFISVCLIFYFLEAIIGIPAFYVLTRRRWRHFLTYTAVGFLAVFVPFFALCLARWNASYEIVWVLCISALVGIFGAASGLIFWLLVRPDKDSVEQIASHFT